FTHWLFYSSAAAPSELYTLSLHDALPILRHLTGVVHAHQIPGLSRLDQISIPPDIGSDHRKACAHSLHHHRGKSFPVGRHQKYVDRKSTRLNSSHVSISYAVFCLKKKKKT